MTNAERLKSQNELVISYLNLRKTIGILGILFPLVLGVGAFWMADCQQLQQSISAYYHTGMRDVFVGIICAIALFLYTYKGYDIKDSIACKFAALCALGIAFFPTAIEKTGISQCTNFVEMPAYMGKVHIACAALFFLTLAYISIWLFTESDQPKFAQSEQKRKRTSVYKVCGIIILTCISLIALNWLVIEKIYPAIAELKPVFWLETVALLAFGCSWVTKGQLILKDHDTVDLASIRTSENPQLESKREVLTY